MAIDNFVVQAIDGSAFDARDKLARLEDVIRQTLGGGERPRQRLDKRKILGQKQDAFHIEPSVVVEVEYGSWPADGNLRHPVYAGLRLDKDPAEVVRELPPEAPDVR